MFDKIYNIFAISKIKVKTYLRYLVKKLIRNQNW